MHQQGNALHKLASHHMELRRSRFDHVGRIQTGATRFRRVRMKKKKRKHIILTVRNHVALAALFHGGVRTHPYRKKVANKRACRKGVID